MSFQHAKHGIVPNYLYSNFTIISSIGTDQISWGTNCAPKKGSITKLLSFTNKPINKEWIQNGDFQNSDC